MRLRLRYLIPCVILAALPACAQEIVAPGADRSLPQAFEAIQQARVRTRVLFITAHPDDESSSLLTYLSRGLGADVALLTLTRGEGGQNSIGTEQGPAMGMLRTAELYNATQIYGATLFFTRAPDFGYSKSADESLKIWDGQVLGDIVRVIRTFRPDVVINGWGGVHGGHGQHQASGILVPQAFDAAADAKQFPEQLKGGLQPWRAAELAEFWRGDGAPPESAWRIPADEVSPIWGKSYIDIGREGVLRHRSQSLSAFIDSPFFRRSIYLHSVKGEKLDSAVFGQPITSLGGETDSFKQLLSQADQLLERAQQAELGLRWPESVRELADAATTISKARAIARESEWELSGILKRINRALLLALAMKIEARADRAELVAGDEFSVRVNVYSRPATEASFGAAKLELPDGWTITKSGADQAGGTQITVTVPPDARPPAQPDAWMYPWPAALVKAQVHVHAGSYEFDAEEPVIARHATSTTVEDLPLELVPAVTLNVEPKQIVMRSQGPRNPIELQVRVRYYGTKPAKISLGLDVPSGWTASVP